MQETIHGRAYILCKWEHNPLQKPVMTKLLNQGIRGLRDESRNNENERRVSPPKRIS